MSKTPKYDVKVKAILDSTKPGERTCALTGEKWNMTEEEIGWYKKFHVPPSSYAPITRKKLMTLYFAAFDFWYNTHAQTGKPILSIIHPSTGIRVLGDVEWFARDFTDHGQVCDSGRPFLDQLYVLSRAVPRAAHFNIVNPENSVAFLSGGDQDSYFVVACRSKRTFYSANAFDVEDSAELDLCGRVRESYNAVHSARLYRCLFIRDCLDCLDSAFLFDCRDCKNCFLSSNKRHRQYLWMNEQLTKEEWERRRVALDLRSFAERKKWEKRFEEMIATSIWPENFNEATHNATGEYLEAVTDSVDCFRCIDGGRNLYHVSFCFDIFGPSESCAFCEGASGSSECFYSCGVTQSRRSHYCMNRVVKCQNVEYCESCFECEDCFGCIGLHHKRFCILNKQYTEEEYWKMLDEIKCAMLDRGEYGEVAPGRFSTQRWQGSGAVPLLGLTREEALRLGSLDVSHEEGPAKEGESPDILPDRVDESDEEGISARVFYDKAWGRRFTYTCEELELYQKFGVAPPRVHPSVRLSELIAYENKPLFVDTACHLCRKKIRTASNFRYPNRTIYCRFCYLKYLEEHN